MPLLPDHKWKLKYTPDDGNLVQLFYVPALEAANRYHRSTGYFGATALTLAARGIEGIVRNGGYMKLIVGCTLGPQEVEAIEKGQTLRDAVEQHIGAFPLAPGSQSATDALELLAWMVAKGILEVKVAVPCDLNRRPMAAEGIFHEKVGIIEDKAGDRIAWNGSLNETEAGWMRNAESFHVFTSWGPEPRRVDEEEDHFAKVWANKSLRVITLDVPSAVRDDLMRFLPTDDRPARMKEPPPTAEAVSAPIEEKVPQITASELRRLIWGYIKHAPSMANGGERIGEATAAVDPWPHQIRAFHRMYDNWPPKLLIADEVGLGKTIEAGLLLRQAWIAGKAKRILILAPKAVLKQWQMELREKFNLNWPVYDGQKLCWYPSKALQSNFERQVKPAEWHNESCVIASSQLMRRESRATELLAAEPWDIVVLDEAHHARRRAGGVGNDVRPNKLLRLMRELKNRTDGLLLLTATPMQVAPVEVWDLMNLLGLPDAWNESAFLRFFNIVEQPNPSADSLDEIARLFQTVEHEYGEVPLEEAMKFCAGSRIKAKRILRALRDKANLPRLQLENVDRKAAIGLMRANTPVRKLVSRHTRELLRRYYKEGKLTTPIADRSVGDEFIQMSPEERALYEEVENYISRCYNAASAKERTAVGFVMTIYRRRLASSFYALKETLTAHLAAIKSGHDQRVDAALEDDVFDSEVDDELLDSAEAAELERDALLFEERSTVEVLLTKIQALPPDSKLQKLKIVLDNLQTAGYKKAMVFTQYTDTMDYLRDYLGGATNLKLMCYSGRGGEVRNIDGSWTRITREDAKRRFRDGQADVLLCTDAAAEGLNFQFCGAMVNYDMPWNPMRVEQRIGRIDRLGQLNEVIRIVNLHLDDTVETDVYRALRNRIGLFEKVVGQLQPILSQLPKRISETVFTSKDRGRVVAELEEAVVQQSGSGLDLDAAADSDLDLGTRPAPLYSMEDIDRIVSSETALPAGIEAHGLRIREYSYLAPGMKEPVRITTDPEYYKENTESLELWSPGNPLFPTPKVIAQPEELPERASIGDLLDGTVAARAKA
jgi:SNF2 family DNA or RNA helicase